MRQNHYCCVWEIGSDLGGKRSRGGPSLCEIFLKTSTKLFLDVVTKSIFIFIYFYFFLVGPFRFLNHSFSLLPPVLFTVTRSLTELSSETKVSEKFSLPLIMFTRTIALVAAVAASTAWAQSCAPLSSSPALSTPSTDYCGISRLVLPFSEVLMCFKVCNYSFHY